MKLDGLFKRCLRHIELTAIDRPSAEPLVHGNTERIESRGALEKLDCLRRVPQILPVRLERHRLVGDDLDPVEVVTVDDVRRSRLTPTESEVPEQAGQRARGHPPRSEEIETELEPGLGGNVHREWAGVRVRVRVGDEREGRAPMPGDLDSGLEAPAPLDDQAGELPHEDVVASPGAVVGAPPRLDPAGRLGVDAEPRREAEPSPVHPAQPDPADQRLLGPGDQLRGAVHVVSPVG